MTSRIPPAVVKHARCNTPHKMQFISRSEARQAAKRTGGGNMRVYRCAAGHWHVTSHPSHPKIRRAR